LRNTWEYRCTFENYDLQPHSSQGEKHIHIALIKEKNIKGLCVNCKVSCRAFVNSVGSGTLYIFCVLFCGYCYRLVSGLTINKILKYFEKRKFKM
jgi:hypothetical protein